jgi:predicted MFS family arabinose efflux permease
MNLYAPQAVLPMLAHDFAVGPAGAGLAVTATTIGVALTAPFSGVVADVLGRKRIITTAMCALVIPTIMVALASDLSTLIVWRFIQGLMLPPIFAVTIAYIGEEWPAAQAVGVTGVYVSASGLGSFFGRFGTAVVADLYSWREAFLVHSAVIVSLAIGVATLLPREQEFVRSGDFAKSIQQMAHHLRNIQLLATYVVGFGMLFAAVAVYTYVGFRLSAPPFDFSATLVGAIFVIYLSGSAVSPWAGQLIGRFGRKQVMVGAIAIWLGGLSLLLVPVLPVIVIGLIACTACGFLCWAISTNFVTAVAQGGLSSAVGLFVTSYYIGGSAGGVLPGLLWNVAGWPGCVVAVALVLTTMVTTVWLFWPDSAKVP